MCVLESASRGEACLDSPEQDVSVRVPAAQQWRRGSTTYGNNKTERQSREDQTQKRRGLFLKGHLRGPPWHPCHRIVRVAGEPELEYEDSTTSAQEHMSALCQRGIRDRRTLMERWRLNLSTLRQLFTTRHQETYHVAPTKQRNLLGTTLVGPSCEVDMRRVKHVVRCVNVASCDI